MNLFISTAYAQAAANPGPAGGLSFFAPLIIVFLIFYFLVIRPQQKQQKVRAAMIQSLQKGAEVVTTAGIYGKVVESSETTLTLEIAPNVKIKVDRDAVSRLQAATK